MDRPNRRARLYDWKHERFLRRQLRDVEFYDRLARRADGRVLELGCGTGRVTVDLAGRGHEVVGLDRDPEMLARARERAETLDDEDRRRLQFVDGDMRDFDLGEAFDLVCVPYNTFQCLHTLEAQRRCLRSVRDHLAADGLFSLELTPFQTINEPSDWEHRVTDLFADGRTVVAMYERVRQNDANQLTHFDQRFELFRADGTTETLEETLTLRTVYRFECQLLLEEAGFALADVYGTYDLETYESEKAHTMLPVVTPES